jgi:hypothetical protein
VEYVSAVAGEIAQYVGSADDREFVVGWSSPGFVDI